MVNKILVNNNDRIKVIEKNYNKILGKSLDKNKLEQVKDTTKILEDSQDYNFGFPTPYQNRTGTSHFSVIS